MSLYEEIRTIFRDYSSEAFKGLHHQEIMFVWKTDLMDRDSLCMASDECYLKGELDWKKIKLIHEDQYVLETR